MAGFRLDLDRAAIGHRLQPGAGGNRRIPHRRKHLAQATAFKGRVDDAALAFPGGAIGDEDRLAQPRFQPLADAVGLREIHRPPFQDQFDKLRIIAQVRPEKRRAKFGHPGVVQPRGLGRQDIVAKQLQIAQQSHLFLS